MQETSARTRPRRSDASAIFAAVALFVASASLASVARAHPLVDAGVQYATEARFEEALSSFDAAWLSDGLTREDVITLLSHRVIVHFALRSSQALERDLGFLVVLDPTFEFPANVPPPVRDRFEQLRRAMPEPPRITVAASYGETSATLIVRMRGMPESLVRDVHLAARPVGGSWLAISGPRLELPMPTTQAIEWYVEVVGPGGAIIAREGQASSPRRTLPPSVFVATAPARPDEPVRDDPNARRRRRGWAIGSGVAAAAILTSIVVGVVRDPAPTTHVSGPVLR